MRLIDMLDVNNGGFSKVMLWGVLLVNAVWCSAQTADFDRSLKIIQQDRLSYEEQLIHFARVITQTQKTLDKAISELSDKKTEMAMAEKQALREGVDTERQRFTKRLTLAVKFAEGQVDLQQRRLQRLQRKREHAKKGLRLLQEAESAVTLLQRQASR